MPTLLVLLLFVVAVALAVADAVRGGVRAGAPMVGFRAREAAAPLWLPLPFTLSSISFTIDREIGSVLQWLLLTLSVSSLGRVLVHLRFGVRFTAKGILVRDFVPWSQILLYDWEYDDGRGLLLWFKGRASWWNRVFPNQVSLRV